MDVTENQKAVLLATDLTARCDRALERATALAREWDGKVTLLHIVSGTKQSASLGDAEIADRIRADIGETSAEVEILIGRGSVPETIARMAASRSSDIIVTGVGRYNGLGDFLLGTAVDHIVRHAEAPVLVVKQRVRGPYRNLLVATDLSPCSVAALRAAARLFPEATLHLVHAYHVPYEAWLNSDQVSDEVRSEAERQLHDFLWSPAFDEQLRLRVNVRLGYGELATVVAEEIERVQADLVVLGTHGRSGFAHATIGSNAESLLSWLPRDVLMVREVSCRAPDAQA
jgi:nucleotide-binding universal stress UspA family protein